MSAAADAATAAPPSSSSRPRRASLQSGLFGKLLHDRDPDLLERNSGAWIVALSTLQSKPALAEVRLALRERVVKRFARFRSRLVLTADKHVEFKEVGGDDELDWDYHVPDMSLVDVAAKIKTRADLYAYMGTLNDYDYDLNKPLWRVLVLPPLVDGTSAQVFCVNHALGDGQALIVVAETLYDYPPPLSAAPPPPPPPVRTVSSPTSRVATTTRSKLSLLAKVGIFLYGIYCGGTMQFTRPDDANALRLPEGKRPLGRKLIAAAQPIPLDKIKELRARLGQGTTINDVFMALMTLALKRFFQQHTPGFRLENKVTAQFPISMRPAGQHPLDVNGEPHNFITYAFFQFDFTPKSRVHTVWAVKHQIDCIKLSPAPAVLIKCSDFALTHLPHDVVLTTLAKVGNIGTAQLSNVAAPAHQVTTYGGIPVLDMSFFLFSPLTAYLGIMTYNNQASASFNLDSGLGVDPTLLAKAWDEEFQLLYSEVMEAASAEELDQPAPPVFFYEAVAGTAVAVSVGLVAWGVAMMKRSMV